MRRPGAWRLLRGRPQHTRAGVDCNEWPGLRSSAKPRRCRVEQPADVIHDPAGLRRLVAERTFDLRTLDLPGFRRWLDLQLPHWQADAVFAQRARIRDLNRAHPEPRRLKREVRRAAEVDAATPQAARLGEVEKALRNAAKAIAGLT